MAHPKPFIRHLSSLAVLLAAILSVTLISCRTTSDLTLKEAQMISSAGEQGFTPPPRAGVAELAEHGYLEGLKGEFCRDEPPEPVDLDSIISIIKDSCIRTGYSWGGQYCLADRLFMRGQDAMNSGRYLEAIALIKTALKKAEGKQAQRYRPHLAASYAAIGDFSAARWYMGGGDSRFFRSQSGKYQVHVNYQVGKASLQKAKGNYQAAEAHYRKARKYCEDGRSITGHSVFYDTETQLLPDYGEVIMMQGRLVEAELVLREAVARRAFQGRPTSQLRALGILGRLFYQQGRYADAEMMFKATIGKYRVYREPCWQIDLNTAHHGLATALLAQGRIAEALAEFETIRRNMRHLPQLFESRFANDPDWAYALLCNGAFSEAEEMLTRALQSAVGQYGDEHHRTAEIRGLLATAQYRQGHKMAAGKNFATALSLLLKYNRAADTQAIAQVAFNRRLAWIVETYMVFIYEGADNGAAARKTFPLADVIRGQSVQQAVIASSMRIAAKDPRLADLVRREQDAGKKITALNAVLLNSMSQSDGGGTRTDELRKEIAKLQQARAVIIAEIEKKFPSYAEHTRPRPKELADIKKALQSDEALLAYYVGYESVFVWSIPGQGTARFAVLPLKAVEIEKQVAAIRKSLKPKGLQLSDLPRFDLAAAKQLYQGLLAPVEESWQVARHLIIVPHGQLGHLPFGLLVTPDRIAKSLSKVPLEWYRKVPWLIREYSITVLPSSGSLLTLRQLPEPDPNRRAYAGFGDPVFNQGQAAMLPAGPSNVNEIATRAIRITEDASLDASKLTSATLDMLQPLPDTREEVLAIAKALNADAGQDVFLGNAASETTVKQTNLSDRRVLVFATHGLVPGDLDGLRQPALALSSPKLTGHTKNDGLLKMGEIMGLRLNADWVVLSACNTAAGQGAGSEAVSGLGRAFFYAGTRALLVSNWPVESASARMLTTELFNQQEADPKLSRAVALQKSMLKLLDHGVSKNPKTG